MLLKNVSLIKMLPSVILTVLNGKMENVLSVHMVPISALTAYVLM